MTMQFAHFPLLSAVLLSCLTGLVLILLVPGERKGLIKGIGLCFSGITLALTVILFVAFDRNEGGLQFVEQVSWVKPLGITYFNAVDGFNLPLLLLTGIIFFTGVLTMWELQERVKEFLAFFFLLVAVWTSFSFSSGTTCPSFPCTPSSPSGEVPGKSTAP